MAGRTYCISREKDNCLRARYHGTLIGLAAGDALGTTLEFKAPGTFEPLRDIVGGGPFGLDAGQWTDDTSMALCLAESLVERGRFDPDNQMRRYLRWYREGHLSSTGTCFDIGATIGAALHRFEVDQNPFAGETESAYGGNGSLMRLAPVPLAFANHPENAIRLAGEMSRTTHGAPEPVDACRYFAGLIVGALEGRAKDELLSSLFSPVPGQWQRESLAPRIGEIAAGAFKVKQPPVVRGTGYVVNALEAALWAFWHTDEFESGALAAVNLGDDADTTGAIYGQLAGAFYGVDAIPDGWRDKLAMSSRILELADGLFDLSGRIETREQEA
jgi:ADP-ribosylglycohydrolase